MQDDETGTWWQQVSGEAILGPLKGRRLALVPSDQLTFGMWAAEAPNGRVLRPDDRVSRAGLVRRRRLGAGHAARCRRRPRPEPTRASRRGPWWSASRPAGAREGVSRERPRRRRRGARRGRRRRRWRSCARRTAGRRACSIGACEGRVLEFVARTDPFRLADTRDRQRVGFHGRGGDRPDGGPAPEPRVVPRRILVRLEDLSSVHRRGHPPQMTRRPAPDSRSPRPASPAAKKSAPRRLAGLGYLRAVLRLGKRADARPSRRAVLAARGVHRGRSRARARVRDRTRVAAAGARGRRSRGHRSLRSDAGASARAGGTRRRGPANTGRADHAPRPALNLVRGDIRALPFEAGAFAMVLAPYGILQSLIRPRDLTSTLASVARVLAPGGTFGIDLVPDVPKWREYRNRVQMRGRAGGADITLVESVSQDRAKRLTTFEQRYIRRRGGRTTEHAFDLTFRTLSVPQMTAQLAPRRIHGRRGPRRLSGARLGRPGRRVDPPGPPARAEPRSDASLLPPARVCVW